MSPATCAYSVTVWFADQRLLSFPAKIVFCIGPTFLAVDVDPFDQAKRPATYETSLAYLIFRNEALSSPSKLIIIRSHDRARGDA